MSTKVIVASTQLVDRLAVVPPGPLQARNDQEFTHVMEGDVRRQFLPIFI